MSTGSSQDGPETVPGINWAGNVSLRAARRERPTDLPALQGLVSSSRRIRAVGTGHSFSPIADTDGVLVSVAGLPRRIDLDRDRRVVALAGQWTYGQLARKLDQAGMALPNVASLPHISVAEPDRRGAQRRLPLHVADPTGSPGGRQRPGVATRAIQRATSLGQGVLHVV